MGIDILVGDVRERIKDIPDNSINCCITSPPYYGQRRYLSKDSELSTLEIGREASPLDFIDSLVSVFDEVNRVLTKNGTLWVNIADTYVTNWGAATDRASSWCSTRSETCGDGWGVVKRDIAPNSMKHVVKHLGLKVKDLIQIPYRFAESMQRHGWYLRQDIIWYKPDAMGETATDRPHTKHEHLLMFSKSMKYYYDSSQATRISDLSGNVVNIGSVWTIKKARAEGHCATFPVELVEPCIRMGCPVGGTVLDPFGGAGTTGLVAQRLGRHAKLIELNPDYANLARARIDDDLHKDAA